MCILLSKYIYFKDLSFDLLSRTFDISSLIKVQKNWYLKKLGFKHELSRENFITFSRKIDEKKNM